MYLKSIEIQGFKSFANKILFEFHNGITGIVGPNGSGKSNVADAVRWVLGEQRAKQLRGGSMQDVIFAGTELRKPQGFAYVAITLDNSDHQLAIDYDEVTVSRRLYRSGESEYKINGSTCRLKDISELFYDTGKRQIGSTIKPILYTLAMQEGLGPCDQVLNVQQTFVLPDGTTWTPRNSTDKREGEMVTLKWGLANSVNNISGWVLKQFTPEAVVQMAHRMGITSYIDPVPAIFLGSSEVSVKEMVGAFSIYANKGVYNAPMMVTKIEDKYGNVLANFYPESREVITENTAFLMANLLQGVVDEGTGRRLRFRYGFKNQIGGKTGTTQNHSDGWFIGITPDLAGGVWVGAEDRSIHFQNLANGQGASMALPIWALFMQKVYADKSLAVPQSDFQKPNGVNHVLDCGDADREGMTDYDSSDEIFD